jgi:16S rRNA (uracil1498-N3)-methyltransferase
VGDEIYITNGKGEIFLTAVVNMNKNSLIASIKDILKYENIFSHITFCIPKLKSSDRFEFALEKCTELGITNFIVFDSERVMQKSSKIERWEKIILSAMKQSLRSYLPKIEVLNSVNDILNSNGRKILLEQNSHKHLSELKINNGEKNFFIFGPEGGLTKQEMNSFDEHYKLSDNRLRTETAVIKCASIILE